VLIIYVESRTFPSEGAASASTALLSGSLASSSNDGTPSEQRLLQGAGLRMSKLTFVDMAGTDRLEISGAVGDTLVESQNINLSLNAFGT
jgi:hypothetical protein